MTTVRVLVVTDGDGSFHKHGQRFGLTEFVAALTVNAGDLWTFAVTTAHRYAPGDYSVSYRGEILDVTADADVTGFRFDAQHFPLDAYDEVLLFGFATTSANNRYDYPTSVPALSQQELARLAEFMEAGGGVFGVGDHDDLGIDLCGNVPRVRSMRRWAFDYLAAGPDYSGYDESSHNAPPALGPHRHSTIVADVLGQYTFDCQSDDIPQTNQPVIYGGGRDLGWAVEFWSYPHPLLCGRSGVINVLPDHMHEGECEVPADLSASYAFAGGPARREYPDLYGSPLAPQVVAWQNVVARGTGAYTDPGASAGYDDNEPLDADRFGQVAAWDGHLVGAGRVSVDSTFHHFVNVNVVGDVDDALHTWNNDEAVKAQGFPGSASGAAAYARIKEYWRNIAIWIAPSALHDAHALAWYAALATDPQLAEEAGYLGDGLEVAGAHAGSVLARNLAPCERLRLISRGVPDPWWMLLGHWYELLHRPDPPPFWVDLIDAGIDVERVARVALGAAVAQTRQLLRSQQRLEPDGHLRSVQEATGRAIARAVRTQLKARARSLQALERLAGAEG